MKTGTPLLGIEAAVEWEAHLLSRDAEIADFFGLRLADVTRLRENHPCAWRYRETRMHDKNRAPQRTYPARKVRIAARPGRIRRLLDHLTGAALVLIAVYFIATLLIHHL